MKAMAAKQPSNDFHRQRQEVIQAPMLQNEFPVTDVLQRMSACPCGGGCPSCEGDMVIQPKLRIGVPGDWYEREADRVADEVMLMPEPGVQLQVEHNEEEEETLQTKSFADKIMPLIQRQVDPEEEEETIQAKLSSGQTPQVSSILQNQIHSFRGSGQPLSPFLRNFFEPRFNYDFRRVRIHNDNRTAESARTLNAQAYTVGLDVVFGAGRYEPETTKGRRLLAHELTHVIQQKQSLGHQIHYSEKLVQLTPTSNAIAPLLSYFGNFYVSEDDEIDILDHLHGDSDLSATITHLNSQDLLDNLIERVDEPANRRNLIILLGARLNATARALVQPHIARLGPEWVFLFLSVRLACNHLGIITLVFETGTNPDAVSVEEVILGRLQRDSDLSSTITNLDSDNDMLRTLFEMFDEPVNRRNLIILLGARLNAATRTLVQPHITRLGPEWELQFNLGHLGVTTAAPAFDPSLFASLISSDPRASFTGVGATGVNPNTLSIIDPDALLRRLLERGTEVGRQGGNAEEREEAIRLERALIRAEYSNPGYQSPTTLQQPTQQAVLLLRQRISSVRASSYVGNIPNRAQVISAAARRHNLHPELIAGFILAEQRDQSVNEDAGEYFAATTLLGGLLEEDTSLGLGQVNISTARMSDLFADLLSEETRRNLVDRQIAELLVSDEFNIFATARYIREVANNGSRIDIVNLPNFISEFPGMDMAAYANNSVTWPDDNIRALAVEYTSRPWDDDFAGSLSWAYDVFESYQDVIASGVF